MVTPPVGLNLFVTSGVAKLPVTAVIRAAMPWLVVLAARARTIVTYVPGCRSCSAAVARVKSRNRIRIPHHSPRREARVRSVDQRSSRNTGTVRVGGPRRARALAEIRGVILKPNSADVWAIHPFTLMPTTNWVQTERKGVVGELCLVRPWNRRRASSGHTSRVALGAEHQPLQFRLQDKRASDEWIAFTLSPERLIERRLHPIWGPSFPVLATPPTPLVCATRVSSGRSDRCRHRCGPGSGMVRRLPGADVAKKNAG